jgi:hypothetical protein
MRITEDVRRYAAEQGLTGRSGSQARARGEGS